MLPGLEKLRWGLVRAADTNAYTKMGGSGEWGGGIGNGYEWNINPAFDLVLYAGGTNQQTLHVNAANVSETHFPSLGGGYDISIQLRNKPPGVMSVVFFCTHNPGGLGVRVDFGYLGQALTADNLSVTLVTQASQVDPELGTPTPMNDMQAGMVKEALLPVLQELMTEYDAPGNEDDDDFVGYR